MTSVARQAVRLAESGDGSYGVLFEEMASEVVALAVELDLGVPPLALRAPADPAMAGRPEVVDGCAVETVAARVGHPEVAALVVVASSVDVINEVLVAVGEAHEQAMEPLESSDAVYVDPGDCVAVDDHPMTLSHERCVLGVVEKDVLRAVFLDDHQLTWIGHPCSLSATEVG